jgi:3-hydroxyacyl-CoA dehydrogenase
MKLIELLTKKETSDAIISKIARHTIKRKKTPIKPIKTPETEKV